MHLRLLTCVTLLLTCASVASAEKELLWGDTHVHTNLSPDSYMNQNFSIDPEAAYRFARGLPVVHLQPHEELGLVHVPATITFLGRTYDAEMKIRGAASVSGRC